jgi:hypothetical protein
MRNNISTVSARNATGSTLSSHHSGVTSVLIDSEPACQLPSAARTPYQAMIAQHAMASRSTSHSSPHPRRGGTARNSTSTRMCCPRRISHGAVSSAIR